MDEAEHGYILNLSHNLSFYFANDVGNDAKLRANAIVCFFFGKLANYVFSNQAAEALKQSQFRLLYLYFFLSESKFRLDIAQRLQHNRMVRCLRVSNLIHLILVMFKSNAHYHRRPRQRIRQR